MNDGQFIISHTSLKMMFWNTRSIKQRTFELDEILSELDVFVAVESWLNPTDTINFTGFKIHSKDRENMVGGGILVAVRKKYSFSLLQQFVNFNPPAEITGIKVHGIDKKLNIVVVYRPPDQNMNQAQWNELLENCSKLKEHFY